MEKLYLHEVQQIIALAEATVKEHPEVRMGQALYHELFLAHPEIAQEATVRGLEAFYDDDKINKFLSFITMK